MCNNFASVKQVPANELWRQSRIVDMLSSNGFLPVITCLTRVNPTSATLIDNIFTNNIADVYLFMQEFFVTDVSHHYHFFYMNRELILKKNGVYRYKRVLDPYNKDTFHPAPPVQHTGVKCT